MQTEDLVFNNCGEWKVVEKFSEHFPNVSVAVLAETLIIKTVPSNR